MTFTTRPELVGSFGMTASTHWLASAAGMAVLERGGNAFDAAVAMGTTLHVVEPHLNGLGGDAPIIGYDAASGSSWVVCGQGPAPAAATIEAFERLGLDLVPGTGHLSAVVPGAFGAWMELLARHGTLPLRDILGYAVHYARSGHPLLPTAAATIGRVEGMLRDAWPTSAAVYLPGGVVPDAGARFANPDLADTFERLIAAGESASSDPREQALAAREAFYRGFVADAIDAFVREPVLDTSGTEHAGLLTGDDLAGWSPPVEQAASVDFAGARVLKPGAWSQGPALLQQLRMLERLGVADAEPGSADLVHAVTEAAKLAFADRDAFYGDPEFTDVPLDALLSDEYTDARIAEISPVASADLRPGSPGSRTGRLPAAALGGASVDPARLAALGVTSGVGEPTVRTSGLTKGDTCHLDVVDRWGNAVSATPSGAWLQSSPVIPGLGFSLPTRAQMFWLEPGLPNSLEPGKRPRTTLSPGMVLRDDGTPRFAFGTPGGDQQDQWTVPFLLHALCFGANLQAAIDAPSWHTTHLVSSFWPREVEALGLHAESRLGEHVMTDLRARGHDVVEQPAWSLGRISAAGVRSDGMLVAAANPRGMQGYAVGR